MPYLVQISSYLMLLMHEVTYHLMRERAKGNVNIQRQS